MWNMQRALVFLVATAPFVLACGATFPVPTQRMADAQSAERSATELGAPAVPQAQLMLKLAQEQIAQAQRAIADGDNKRADALLIRANADAEFAIALAREKNAQVENQRAIADSSAQKTTNVGQGAVK